MAGALSVTKNAEKARAGRIGARRRWGDPGVVRLDDLTPPQRRLVLALVEAARAEHRRDHGPADPAPGQAGEGTA